jgi:hypothetical protein
LKINYQVEEFTAFKMDAEPSNQAGARRMEGRAGPLRLLSVDSVQRHGSNLMREKTSFQ